MNPSTIVLLISLAANAVLGYAYLGQRDTATVAKTETKQADGVAKACTQAVDNLSTKAEERRAAAAPRIEQARKEADASNRQADQILSAPAAAPGDDCRSAQARVDSWWESRK